MVNRGFPADTRIHLDQQSGRDLNIPDSPHVGGCREPGQITDDSASQSDQHRFPVVLSVHQLIVNPAGLFQ